MYTYNIHKVTPESSMGMRQYLMFIEFIDVQHTIYIYLYVYIQYTHSDTRGLYGYAAVAHLDIGTCGGYEKRALLCIKY